MQKNSTFKIVIELNRSWIVTILILLILTLLGVIFFVNRQTPNAEATSKIILFKEDGVVNIKNPSIGINEFQSVTAEETEIFNNTVIQTQEAYAHVVLPDSSLMSLDKNTTVEIKLANDQRSVISQIAGNTWHRVKEIINPSDDRYQVITPNAVAAVRGTEFGIELIDQVGTDAQVPPLESRISLVDGKLAIIKKEFEITDIDQIVIEGEYNLEKGYVAIVDSKTDEPIVSEIPDELKESTLFKRNQTISEQILEDTKALSKEKKSSFLREIWVNRDLNELKVTQESKEVANSESKLSEFNKRIREILQTRNIVIDKESDTDDEKQKEELVSENIKNNKNPNILLPTEPKDNLKNEDKKAKEKDQKEKLKENVDSLYLKLSKIEVIKQEKVRVKTDILKTQKEISLIQNKINDLQARIRDIDSILAEETRPSKRYDVIVERRNSNNLITSLKQALEFRNQDLNIKNSQLSLLSKQQNQLQLEIENQINDLDNQDKNSYKELLEEAKKDITVAPPTNEPVDPSLDNLLGRSTANNPSSVVNSITAPVVRPIDTTVNP
jgi:hypothetical protein